MLLVCNYDWFFLTWELRGEGTQAFNLYNVWAQGMMGRAWEGYPENASEKTEITTLLWM